MNKGVMAVCLFLLVTLPLGCCYSVYGAAYFLWLSATPGNEAVQTTRANMYYLHLAVVGASILLWFTAFFVYYIRASKS